jgi:glyoxylase-like metal-dependent hydrolase (beta-lactamase superfamily II)
MLKKSIVAVVSLAMLSVVAAGQDAKTVISNASKAMGYDQLKSIEYTGSGFEGTAMGQAQSATAGWPKFTLRNFTRYIDITAGTSQQTAARSRPADPATGQLPGGGGLAPAAESQQTTVVNANQTFPQRVDVTLSPPVFLKLAAAASNPTATSRNISGKRFTVVTFSADAKAPSGVPYMVSGYINSDNMVERVETAIEENSGLIGDVIVEQTYSGYKDFSGVKFPTKIQQKRAGLSWTDVTVTDVKANVAAPPPPAPAAGRGGAGGGGGGGAAGGGRGGDGRGGDAGRGAAAAAGGGGQRPGGPPAEGQRGAAAPAGGAAGGRGGAAAIGSKKLADGIYMITGGYRSVAVEMRDHIVLIEAPQNEMTTSNILAEVKKIFPDKPIRYVVNTHSHFDHSGGLRAAVAEGATIVTHELNKPLYEKWFSNPRTLYMPDKLAQSGRKPKFEYFEDKKVMRDNMNTIELYHLRGALHGEDTIVAYLPKIKTIVEADAFNAPAPNAPTPQNINGFERLLASELDRLKIDYTTIIPVHQPGGGDREVTKGDLLRNIGRGN